MVTPSLKVKEVEKVAEPKRRESIVSITGTPKLEIKEVGKKNSKVSAKAI